MEEVDRLAIIRVKQQLGSLFKPKLWIYWLDLSLSAASAWAAFVWSLHVTSVWSIALLLFVCVYAMYRTLLFTHELEHQPDGALPWIRPAWHLAAGMPFGLPHFVYRDIHRIHHSTGYYGTPDDPEYFPYVARGSYREPIMFAILPFLFPLIIVFRYLVLSPLALFVPAVRTAIDTKASAFVAKFDFVRTLPTGREMRIWRVEEYTTTAFWWAVLAAVWFGLFPATVLLHWWIVYVTIMQLNSVRGLTAHRYCAPGHVLTFEGHIHDSVNLEGYSPLNMLVGPLGLHMHATHHVFPTLPYYALRKAHRLLMKESEAEGQPLKFYVAGQWSNVLNAARINFLGTRAARKHLAATAPKPSVAPVLPEA